MAELHPQISILSGGAAPGEDAGPPQLGDTRRLAEMRAEYAQTAVRLGGDPEPVAAVADVVIPSRSTGGRGIPARAYRPAVPAEPVGAILWLHGGGWCVGDLDGFDRVCRSLSHASGALVVSVDYRLAPENPYPAAVEDADAAVAWARREGAEQLGFDPDRVAIGGDSAGGNLAAVAARHAPEALRAQLLVYPAVDATMGSGSYERFGAMPFLPAGAMEFCWRTYLGERDAARDPDASPLRATDLAGLPPAFIAVAGHDVLRDEGIAYARALQRAGVPVRLQEYEDMAHGFIRWGGILERTHELIAQVGDAARAAFA